ncbi:MAG: hypothetical protein GY861_12450 [bacterium]|nr:hypothetical protein [bacterium]
MPFDIIGARNEGYTDEDIKSFLGTMMDVNGALSEGYSIDEIASYMNEMPTQEAPTVELPESMPLPPSHEQQAPLPGTMPLTPSYETTPPFLPQPEAAPVSTLGFEQPEILRPSEPSSITHDPQALFGGEGDKPYKSAEVMRSRQITGAPTEIRRAREETFEEIEVPRIHYEPTNVFGRIIDKTMGTAVTGLAQEKEERGKQYKTIYEPREGLAGPELKEYNERVEQGKKVAEKYGIKTEDRKWTGAFPVLTLQEKKKIKSDDEKEALYSYLLDVGRERSIETGEELQQKAELYKKIADVIDPTWLRQDEIRDKITKIEQGGMDFLSKAWTQGDIATAVDILSTRVMLSGNKDDIDEMLKIKKDFHDTVESDPNKVQGAILKLLSATVEMLPAMSKSAGLMAVPGIGPLLSGSYWAQQGAGSMFSTILESGVDVETARRVAIPAGILYAMIENLQVGQLLGKAQQKVIQRMINQGVKKNLKKFFVAKTKDWTKENVEEVLQGLIEEFAPDAAKYLAGENIEGANMLERGLKTSWETFKQSAGPLTIIGGPAAMVGGIQTVQRAKGEITAEIGKQVGEMKATEAGVQKLEAEVKKEESFDALKEKWSGMTEEEQDEALGKLTEEQKDNLLAMEARIESVKEKMLEDGGIISESAQKDKRFPATTKIPTVQKTEKELASLVEEKTLESGMEVGKAKPQPELTTEQLAELDKEFPPMEEKDLGEVEKPEVVSIKREPATDEQIAELPPPKEEKVEQPEKSKPTVEKAVAKPEEKAVEEEGRPVGEKAEVEKEEAVSEEEVINRKEREFVPIEIVKDNDKRLQKQNASAMYLAKENKIITKEKWAESPVIDHEIGHALYSKVQPLEWKSAFENNPEAWKEFLETGSAKSYKKKSLEQGSDPHKPMGYDWVEVGPNLHMEHRHGKLEEKPNLKTLLNNLNPIFKEKKLPTPEEIEKKPEGPKPELPKKAIELKEPIPFNESLSEVKDEIPQQLWDKIKIHVAETPGNTQGSIGSDGKYLHLTLNPKMPIERAVPVIFHEVMGHAGAANVLKSNDKVYKRVNALYNTSSANTLKALIKKNYSEEFKGMDKAEADEAVFSEWIAHNIEEHMTNPEKRGTAYKVWRAVRQFLVDMGFAADSVEDAMESIVKEIRKTTEFEADVEVGAAKFAKELPFDTSKKLSDADVNAVPESVWGKVNKFMKGKGYDFRGAEDAKNLLGKRMKHGTLTDIHKEALKKAYGVGKEAKKPVSPDQKMARQAARYFGVTTDMRFGGYLREDGKMLDLSGRKQGNQYATGRGLDHREVGQFMDIDKHKSGTANMQYFQSLGNIRMDYRAGSLDIMKKPTPKQILGIRKLVRETPSDYINIDLSDGLGDLNDRGEYYLGNREQSLSYDKGISPARVINDINRYYKGEKVEDLSQTQKFRYAKDLTAKPFYSPTERKISELKQEKGVVQQISSMIKKGQLKKAEVEWMGLEEWLAENPKATKSEVLDFVRANEVTVEETQLSEKSFKEVFGVDREEMTAEELEVAEDDTRWGATGTKHSTWVLPGGENYRELLFRMPAEREVPFKDYLKEYREKFPKSDLDDSEVERYYESGKVLPSGTKIDKTAFRTSHFDEPNIFSHARVNDRTTPEGENVLFIEEIQSDWAREAREKGVRNEKEIKKYETLKNEKKIIGEKYEKALIKFDKLKGKNNLWLEKDIIKHWGKDSKIVKEYIELQEKFIMIEKELLNLNPYTGVPDFPFRKNWQEFTLKNILKRAVQEGYDRIAWISGEQTADRYDLSKQVDEILYQKNDDGTFVVSAITGGKGNMLGESITPKQLESYIGKDVAKKIVDDEGKKAETQGKYAAMKSLSGENLKIGGEWAKNLYDKQIPTFLKKYTKKWGAKVEETDIETAVDKSGYRIEYPDGSFGSTRFNSEEKAQKVADAKGAIVVPFTKLAKQQSLPITPAMKESVTYEGQPMFSKELKGRDIDGVPVDAFVDEEKKAAIAYEAAKDVWIGEKDVRILRAQVEKRKLQKRIKKALGSKKYGERAKLTDQAIQIYIDSKRSPEDFEKFKDKLTPAQKGIYKMSQNLSPELKKIADEIADSYQEMGLEAQEAEVIKNTLDNYAGRVWDLEEKKGRPTSEAVRKFGTKTGHAKQRTFATILEGWGTINPHTGKPYELKVKGATNNLQILKDSIVKTVEDKRFLKTLQAIKTIDGDPLVTTQQKEGYVQIEHPNFKVWKHAGKAEEGKAYGKNFFMDEEGNLFEKRELYAPKEQAKNLNNILGVSKIRDTPGIKLATKYNAIFKAWILQSSFFHHLAFMRSYYLGTTGKKPSEMVAWTPFIKKEGMHQAYRQGLRSIEEEGPIITQLVRNGLTLGLKQDWNEELLREKTLIGKVLDKTKATKAVKDKILDLREAQADFLFGELGSGLKAKAAMIEYRNLIKKHPNMNTNTAARLAANLINDDFGGLHLARIGKYGRNPTLQHFFRLFFLAPDWTESNIRSMVKMVGAGTKEERAMYQKFWAGIAVKAVILTVAANALLSIGGDEEDELGKKYRRAWKEGHFKWLDVDITRLYQGLGNKKTDRKYFSIAGHFKDPLKFATHPIRSAHHKGSVLYKTFHEMLSGKDWAGRRYTTFGELIGQESELGKEEAEKLAGKTVTWTRGKKGALGYQRIPSYLLAQLKGTQPVQVQNLISYMAGEMEGFDAVMNSLGLGVSTTYGGDEGLFYKNKKRIKKAIDQYEYYKDRNEEEKAKKIYLKNKILIEMDTQRKSVEKTLKSEKKSRANIESKKVKTKHDKINLKRIEDKINATLKRFNTDFNKRVK